MVAVLDLADYPTCVVCPCHGEPIKLVMRPDQQNRACRVRRRADKRLARLDSVLEHQLHKAQRDLEKIRSCCRCGVEVGKACSYCPSCREKRQGEYWHDRYWSSREAREEYLAQQQQRRNRYGRVCRKCGSPRELGKHLCDACREKRLREHWYVSGCQRRARQRSAPEIERISRNEIYERDCGQCRYCGEDCDENDWHLAHLVALSRGGSHTRANVAVSCASCNQADGSGRLPVQLHIDFPLPVKEPYGPQVRSAR